ncbi:DUF1376 domain-containing protein [Psychrobacter sp. CCUG 69069]|jgi:uncharacterized protein YdaU (DUF1376 family)|uniref:DUF1376 domain-containing protein n=1 Tax=unclassified Psychrobacter TaxID=196806 RepID=UPI000C7A9E8A|nr:MULTISPECIES: DUF1376 domain-containing protein [unclassified Psychrobacter]MCD1278285.1 DUF1376 domain-containing protein [Psychrobacter sp. CCUG 69069]PKG61951.1 hypothetical protein CXF56_13770 [Psychrobacter sp. Choline-02u-13]PKH55036.1 hypothetical protein CXF69_00770 [Psychrobacter sp. Choline-02u-9]PKH64453.1 hypothetical protein CXF61_11430 [Psychrobacter sp. 4Dc]|tara:strand:+ start:2566 stop:3702 length:1137 start_codon:yes stop_codon:yes gene_type:complete
MTHSEKNKDKRSYTEFGVMHMIMHKFGDWEIETRYMSRIEKSLYLDMRTIYLKTGESLMSDIDMLSRRLSCRTKSEKKALAFLLKDKFIFDKRTKRYKHSEWEVILKNYKFKNPNKNVTNYISENNSVTDGVTSNKPLTAAERQAKLRKEVKVIRGYLSSIGINSKEVKGITKLRELFYEHKSIIELNSENNNVTSDVTDGHNEYHSIVTQEDAITNKQKLETNNYEKEINHEEWLEEKFELFYAAYPNKKSKGLAEAVWHSVFTGTGKRGKVKHERPDDLQALFDQIMKAVQDQTPIIQASKYQKHPSTWLNAKSWEDEPTIVKASPTMNGKSYNRDNDPQAVNDYWGNPGADMTDEEKKAWIGDLEYYDENKHRIS